MKDEVMDKNESQATHSLEPSPNIIQSFELSLAASTNLSRGYSFYIIACSAHSIIKLTTIVKRNS